MTLISTTCDLPEDGEDSGNSPNARAWADWNDKKPIDQKERKSTKPFPACSVAQLLLLLVPFLSFKSSSDKLFAKNFGC